MQSRDRPRLTLRTVRTPTSWPALGLGEIKVYGAASWSQSGRQVRLELQWPGPTAGPLPPLDLAACGLAWDPLPFWVEQSKLDWLGVVREWHPPFPG